MKWGTAHFRQTYVILCPHICKQVQETDNSCFLNSWLNFTVSVSSS